MKEREMWVVLMAIFLLLLIFVTSDIAIIGSTTGLICSIAGFIKSIK